MSLDFFARTIHELMFTPPTPERGDLGSLRASHRVKRKKQPVWTASSFERKTRLEPALRADNSRKLIFTPPTPERGVLGSLCASHHFRQCKTKKTA